MDGGRNEGDERRGIQSVDAALEILQAVAAAGGASPLGSIAKASGYPASTTHRYLVSLMRGGLVRQDPSSGWYDLGGGALVLGAAALQRMDPIGAAESQASRLAASTGYTCFVSIWLDRGPLIVRWFHGRRPVITSAGVGAVLPPLASSSGQVFAAHLPDHLVDECLRHWPATQSKQDVAELLEQVRARGFAWIDGLIVSGLRGVSVPVFDVQGQVRCALTLLGTEFALIEFPNDAQRELMKAGAAASAQLGGSARVIRPA